MIIHEILAKYLYKRKIIRSILYIYPVEYI